MDHFITLALILFAASQVTLAKDPVTTKLRTRQLPSDLSSSCPDACGAPATQLRNCLLGSSATVCECDDGYVALLNACYFCAVDSNAAGDTVSGFADFDATAAQASLDDLFDTCEQVDLPITKPVFGADDTVASSSAVPASSAQASSTVASAVANAGPASATPATPASASSAPASLAPTGNATASAPEPTKSGSARGVSSVTITVAACALLGALTTFFL